MSLIFLWANSQWSEANLTIFHRTQLRAVCTTTVYPKNLFPSSRHRTAILGSEWFMMEWSRNCFSKLLLKDCSPKPMMLCILKPKFKSSAHPIFQSSSISKNALFCCPCILNCRSFVNINSIFMFSDELCHARLIQITSHDTLGLPSKSLKANNNTMKQIHVRL